MVTVVVVVASEVPSSAVGLDIIMMVVGVDCRLSFVVCRLSIVDCRSLFRFWILMLC